MSVGPLSEGAFPVRPRSNLRQDLDRGSMLPIVPGLDPIGATAKRIVKWRRSGNPQVSPVGKQSWEWTGDELMDLAAAAWNNAARRPAYGRRQRKREKGKRCKRAEPALWCFVRNGDASRGAGPVA